MKTALCWVVTTDRKIRKMYRDDSRLDWTYPHTPPGMVKLALRGKSGWCYVCWGPTPEGAVLSFNRHDLELINRLESEIQAIRAKLLRLEP